jgi:catechol 2,3-dioxygenase-like lactoylglutathione lyase family enzyme
LNIKGISWLGTQTEKFSEMVSFFEKIAGHSPRLLKPDFAMFVLPNGDRLEVYAPESDRPEFSEQPIAGFLVEDIEAARAEMEADGIEFIGPIHTGPRGYAWTHFRAPDGHIYELNRNPNHPANQA